MAGDNSVPDNIDIIFCICKECGARRPVNLSKPCPGCEALKENETWARQNPDPVKYLEDRGWQRIYLEKGFPGHEQSLGWWQEKLCLTQQRYFTQDQAIRLQRQVDQGVVPRIGHIGEQFVVI